MNTKTALQGAWKKYPKSAAHPKGLWTVLVQGGATGDRFIVISQADVVTTGTLDTLHKTVDGLNAWTVVRDTKTPEQQATDRALRASHTAAFWSSPKGAETTAKIAARAMKHQTNTVTESEAAEVAATVSAPVTASSTDLATLIAGFIVAGMDAATAASTAMATMAAVNASAPMVIERKPMVAKPMVNVVTSTKRPRTAAQLANDERLRNKATKTPATASATTVPMAASAQRKACLACGKQDHLRGHAAHPELLVCGTCITADGDTVANRAMRRAAKLAQVK